MNRPSVSIKWTETAKTHLSKLPKKVRKGLFDKADELLMCEDPSGFGKPLVGPLRGYYRICYGRYRAVYTVDKVSSRNGKFVARITVIFVCAGVRKEGDKKDVYRLAQKLVEMGIIRV